jgi:hypothetical protein
MVPQNPLDGLRTGSLQKTAETSAPESKSNPVGGVKFQAMLEDLRAQAGALQSQEVQSAADLPGAVDAARQTLEQALSLGDQLLEAYHQASLQKGGDPNRGPDGAPRA